MSPNRRLFLNIVATYGRSLYALAAGLFCGRWLLLSLGHVDYGLLGVVGGLIGFVTFFNSLMSESVARFYAYSVGQEESMGKQGLEECRRWFSIAVGIHTVLPIVLVAIGYPIGAWAVRHYLQIPPDRIEACVWVWRFSALSCLVGMMSVPFNAMYTAKQEIAELTIYGFATTTLNVLFMSYVITHPGVWLVKYSAWSCFLSVAPSLIVMLRSFFCHPECRFVFAYMMDFARFKRLLSFSGSRFVSMLALLFCNSGIGILVNKCLGPLRNAAMGVGGTVSWHCLSLSASLAGAFSPAITNAAGAGDLARMRGLAYKSCTLSTVAVLVFALPLMLEIDEVLALWLKQPPERAGVFCLGVLICSIMDRLTQGHWVSIFAIGKTTMFNLSEAFAWFCVLPIAYLLIQCGLDVAGASLAFVICNVFAVAVKLHFGRVVAGLSVRHWLLRILLPLTVASGISLAVGGVSLMIMDPSFVRVIVTTALVESAFWPIVWSFALDADERLYIKEKLISRFRK